MMEQYGGILDDIAGFIEEGDWSLAGEAIEKARRQKIPRGTIQDTIHRAFELRIKQAEEKAKQLLAL